MNTQERLHETVVNSDGASRQEGFCVTHPVQISNEGIKGPPSVLRFISVTKDGALGLKEGVYAITDMTKDTYINNTLMRERIHRYILAIFADRKRLKLEKGMLDYTNSLTLLLNNFFQSEAFILKIEPADPQKIDDILSGKQPKEGFHLLFLSERSQAKK